MRISDEQYEQIQKIIELIKVGFIWQFKEYMDLMAEQSEYGTAEWAFRRGLISRFTYTGPAVRANWPMRVVWQSVLFIPTYSGV